MIDLIKEIEEKNDVKIVYMTVSGSRLYGTDNKYSDKDYKFIFIPSIRSVLLKQDRLNIKIGEDSKEKNTHKSIDMDGASIYQFFNLLAKSETGSIDLLFSMFSNEKLGNIVYQDKEFTDKIRDNYKIFLNRGMKSFIGYALGQTKKFGIKGARFGELEKFLLLFHSMTKDNKSKMSLLFPELKNVLEASDFKYVKFVMAKGPKNSSVRKDIEYLSVLGKLYSGDLIVDYFTERVTELFDQFGNRTKTIAKTTSKTDFKALSHSKRVALEALELLETNFIEFPLKEAEDIKRIKEGKADIETEVDAIGEILAKVDELLLDSELPETPDVNDVNKLLLGFIK